MQSLIPIDDLEPKNYRRILYLTIPLLISSLLGCGANSSDNSATAPQELTIFAATSLTDALTEVADAFEAQHPDTQVLLHFAGSSQLAAQLSEGIAADLFASANPAQMQAVIEAGRVDVEMVSSFAANRLTIIVPADNPAAITRLEDLAQPGIRMILAAEGVPIRAYTDEIVTDMTASFQEQFYNNVVSAEENVRQVAAKIALGEADAGIVYQSDVTPELAGQVEQITIPDAQNVTATYPIAPLTDATNLALAERFIAFVLSPEGQAILLRRGFAPPPSIAGN